MSGEPSSRAGFPCGEASQEAPASPPASAVAWAGGLTPHGACGELGGAEQDTLNRPVGAPHRQVLR
jgi:hypothetical protein